MGSSAPAHSGAALPGVPSSSVPAAGGGAPAASGLGGAPEDPPPGSYAFYNPRRYRPYFDVDTKVSVLLPHALHGCSGWAQWAAMR